MNADGSGSTRVRQAPFRDINPLRGAGDTIAFFGVTLHSDRNPSYLYIVRADGTGLMKVDEAHGTIDLSQDGRRMVRALFRNDGTEVHFSDIAGNGGRFIGRATGAKRLLHPSL
jgi:hypothetical protein